jgi:hypothetical protein
MTSSLSKNSLASNSVTLTISVTLDFSGDPFRLRNVLTLVGLGTAAQQKQNLLLPLDEIQTVSGPNMYTHLPNSASNAFTVSKIPQLR